ncbi:amidase signature domain-containing protein [Pelagophyceae sp. CCMP2097]|nr:amidase signature domain-containing protein [Pelagophyceae sp. CCMP2097]
MEALGRRTISQLLQTGAESNVTSALARMRETARLNAFVRTFDETELLDQAKRLDADGDTPFRGRLPVAVKDNLCYRETTAASRVLGAGAADARRFVAPVEAEAVARLVKAGAVVVGKTNMDEFGMGSTGEASAFGPTLNPWDSLRSPGGSSSGSAAAVASGCVAVALGSDTGGSVRQPASWCGVVGLKPRYGTVSRRGLLAYCSSTDTVGPLTNSVLDAATVLQIIAGGDAGDLTTAARGPAPDYAVAVSAAALEGGGAPLRFGLLSREAGAVADGAVADAAADAADRLARASGTPLERIDLASLHEACVAYYVVAACEAFTNLARYAAVSPEAHQAHQELLAFGAAGADEPYFVHSSGLGAEVKRRLALGSTMLGARHAEHLYARAVRVREDVANELRAVFQKVDVLVSPVAPTTARLLGDFDAPDAWADPVLRAASELVRAVVPSLPAAYRDDEFTCFASLSGHAALSLPAARCSQGLPIGVQLVANDECTLLRAGRLHELLTPDALGRR